ncbi:MAG: PAS domain S-box protein [Aliarcobacter sp.]|nr:PAS domain S-box protein [Aliarcobacter sp.]
MQYKGSIKKRLIGIIVSITLLTGLIGYSSFLYWYINNQHDRALNLSKTIALILGQDVAKLILLNNISAAADISDSLKSFSNLNSMVLYKLDGKAILQYSKNNKNFVADKFKNNMPNKELSLNKNIIKINIDANYQDKKLGYIQLNFEVETLIDIIKKDIFVLISILVFTLILSYLMAIAYARKFTNPILDLVNFLEKVELTDSLNKRTKTEEDNEYGKLYDEINRMLERIESSHKILKIAAVTFETQNGITITDKDQKILLVNKAFSKITGYTSDEVVGLTPKILKSGMHDKEFYDEMRESLNNKHIWIGEINNKHKDGSILNEQLTIQTILDDNNDVLYYVASFLDITLQKEMESKLKEKEILLIQKSKMAAMGEMIENIAHQWRQPLSLISVVSSTLLLQKKLDMHIPKDEECEQLTKIGDTVNYLSQTIDDFRSFFKEKKLKENFLLEDCYKKVLNLMSSNFKAMQIDVIENIENVEIETFENELIQVIMNILTNAKDVLLSKGNDFRKLIFIEIYKENDKSIFSIKDNAGGIPIENIEKIFEPYFTTKGDEGTGIGLHMSKEIIQNHMNGELKVENSTFDYQGKEYKGAKFTIILPLPQ